MNARVHCPSSRCGETFEVASSRLGRNVYCVACGTRMTARPVEVERRIRSIAVATAGSRGVAVARLPLVVVVDNVRSLWNVGSIFRTADACGVEELVLTGITGVPPREQITKTALGAEAVVPWSHRAEAATAVSELTGRGYVPVALEASPASRSLDEFRWPERTCLVIGNEVAGVAPDVLARCPERVSIPMRGIKESLNVAVAFGIAVYLAASSIAAAPASERSAELG